MRKVSLVRGSVAPLVLISFLQVLSIAPVGAQEVQIRGGRETNGFIEQRGWEAGMVRGCPNLSHFMWSPMTSMTQCPKHILVQTGAKPYNNTNQMLPAPKESPYQVGKPQTPAIVYQKSPYVKPNRALTSVRPEPPPVTPGSDVGNLNGALLRHPHDNDLAGRLLPRRYIKPIKAPTIIMPREDVNGTLSQNNVSATLGNRNVGGQLVNRGVGARLLPAGPMTATYNSDRPYGGGGGGSWGNGNGYRAHADVSGTISSRGRLLR